MGWCDNHQGNLSAFGGDLEPVEVKMRQIIQDQNEKREEKDKVKTRQKRPGEIGSVSLDVRTKGSLNPKNKRLHSDWCNKYYSAGRGRGKLLILHFFIFLYAHDIERAKEENVNGQNSKMGSSSTF